MCDCDVDTQKFFFFFFFDTNESTPSLQDAFIARGENTANPAETAREEGPATRPDPGKKKKKKNQAGQQLTNTSAPGD
jgi:hypothetical protein